MKQLSKLQLEQQKAWDRHIFGPVPKAKTAKKAWGKLTPAQQQAQLAAATKKLNAAFGVR